MEIKNSFNNNSNLKEDNEKIDPLVFLKQSTEMGVLMTAVSLNLFDFFEENFYSLKEAKLKLNLKCEDRVLEDILDYLSSLNYLERTIRSHDNEVKYKTKDKTYSKSNKDNKIAGITFFYRFFNKTVQCPFFLRNGFLPKEEKGNDELKINSYTEIYKIQNDLDDYVALNAFNQKNNFNNLIENFDFSCYKSILDIGCASGVLLNMLSLKYKHINFYNFDLEKMKLPSENYLTKQGFSNNKESRTSKVTFLTGDVFKDLLPKSDVIIMSYLLHDYDASKKQKLFEIAFYNLNDQGIFLILEDIIDDARIEKREALRRSTQLRLMGGNNGFFMALSEVISYATNSGFIRVEDLQEKYNVKGAVCFKY